VALSSTNFFHEHEEKNEDRCCGNRCVMAREDAHGDDFSKSIRIVIFVTYFQIERQEKKNGGG